jgi:preprotein translocase subunit SecA
MMEAIKEESVGFLFNLEVEVDDESAPAVDAGPADESADDADTPQLDVSLLKAAAEQTVAENGKSAPHINAKGLNRDTSAKPLVYTSPELGSEAPAVQTTKGDNAPAGSPTSSTARRQQSRTGNPNRGSRGNKPTKRKR